MARYFLLSLVFALISTVTFAQTSLAGKVTDGDTGEELIAANVTMYKGGVLITGVTTDFEGNFSINVDPGTYDVETSYVGYAATRTNGVIVRAGQTNKLDVLLREGVSMEEIVVVDYKVPLVEQDNTTQGKIVTSEDIRKFASKNIQAVAASSAGISQADEGDGLSVRGSRSNATDIYVDGMRVRASSVQEADVEQLQVITGGIPAFYGDVTGGIISITTKGPSSKFTGGVEVETSEFLDDYGYNQVRANASGPILKKKGTGESIIGFRFSGAYTSRLDDDPAAIGVYVVNDEKRAELEATPALGIKPTAEFLTNDDVDVLNYRPDEESSNLNFTGKIDARLSKNIDISLTGAYVDDKNKFTPPTVTRGGRENWRLLNSHNNPTDYTKRYRGNFRFRHKLGGNNSVAAAGDGAERKSSLIQNAQYTLQFGFEREKGTRYDHRHEDRFFDYGHYGTYSYEGGPEFEFTPIIDVSDPLNVILIDSFTHTSYETTNNTGFSGEGSRNPVLARYNGEGDSGSALPLIANGIMNEGLEDVWAGLHVNIGQVYNQYRVDETDIITANANFSFDLLPGGSEEGRHSIQVGLLFEQRFARNYALNPERLWEIGQQSVNSHILGLNTDDVIGTLGIAGVFDTDSIREYDIYNTLLSSDEDLIGSRFYREVRNTGIESINSNLSGLHAYVNINTLDPSQLSLDMFAPREIADFSGMTNYYGYDYLGNKLGNDVTFEDFFTAKDADGARSFLVPSFQPNYFAFFLQDKFSFKDIIFRVGLRVDRYDANTKVLKDPYSLYEVATVADLPDLQAPGNIGSDYNVYVESEGSPTVKGYRDGDQWYTAEGTAVNDGKLIFGGGAVIPRLKSPDEANIKVDNYRISNSFEDYKPQINVMPRLAFSFPISDAANFFAHYDILVQRPPSNAIVSPLQYYYFYDRDPPENNGNLKPERTIDYEVGFQQKLSNSSAIKISAYYKEMRDMIQLRNFTQVASVSTEYLAFDNLDFGTVKGFSFQYDLRRTGNISANINYTLQFADGTGSDPESARDLAERGRIRNIYPLNFDERHRIVGSVDYRYDSGKGYNGPRWFGKDVFASAGVNLQAIAVSGRPYTATIQPQSFGGEGTVGSINGARQPWTFTVNLRADKNFTLSKPGAKRPLSLNVYIRVQNLLDARNIVGVYSASGSPTDDGFLLSPLGQAQLNEFSPSERELYQQSYSWTVQNPNNYTQPRRIFMGAIFDF